MKTLHFRLTLLLVLVTPASFAMLQCGGSNPAPADAGDSSMDSPGDASADNVTDDGEAGDDGTDGDEADGGADADQSDGGDGGADATGDGDAADGADGADAGDGGDGGDGGDASDAAPLARCDPDASAGGGDAGEGGAGIPGVTCATGLSCCAGFCVDTSKDPQNCGACGNACSAAQFCTGTACLGATIVNVCGNPKASEVLDPYPTDISSGTDMRTALATWCSPPVAGTVFMQSAATVQEPGTGRPISGVGNTFIAGGGAFGQPSVGYMDMHGLTTVALADDTTSAWYLNRKTGVFIVNTPLSTLTPTHDFLLIELSVEPTSGTLCLFGLGMLDGTAAAGWYFNNVIMPNRAMYTDSWYVYEWTSMSDAGTPGAGDTFRLVDHGM